VVSYPLALVRLALPAQLLTPKLAQLISERLPRLQALHLSLARVRTTREARHVLAADWASIGEALQLILCSSHYIAHVELSCLTHMDSESALVDLWAQDAPLQKLPPALVAALAAPACLRSLALLRCSPLWDLAALVCLSRLEELELGPGVSTRQLQLLDPARTPGLTSLSASLHSRDDAPPAKLLQGWSALRALDLGTGRLPAEALQGLSRLTSLACGSLELPGALCQDPKPALQGNSWPPLQASALARACLQPCLGLSVSA
jgi:hypothetical protein